MGFVEFETMGTTISNVDRLRYNPETEALDMEMALQDVTYTAAYCESNRGLLGRGVLTCYGPPLLLKVVAACVEAA